MTDNGYADSEKMVPVRQPGDGELKVIEPAPGRYVKTTIPEVLGEVPSKS